MTHSLTPPFSAAHIALFVTVGTSPLSPRDAAALRHCKETGVCCIRFKIEKKINDTRETDSIEGINSFYFRISI